MKRTPNIRFKGFDGEWEKRFFKDFTTLSSEKNRNNLPLTSYSVTNDKGFVPQDEKFENGGTMVDADKTAYYIVTPNTFAYNPARINVGSIGYYEGEENVIVSSLYILFKTHSSCDNHFLMKWFKSPQFNKLVHAYEEGGVRLYYFYDKLCKTHVYMPTNKEQLKVSRFLSSIDSLISQRTKEVEKMRNIKRALLEKMFPQNGESVPQIRFKKFTGDWEEKKFDELYYRATVKNDLSFGKDKIISVANMYFNPNIVVSSDDYLRTYNIMKLGDIAYEGNKSANFAYGRFVENSIGDGIVSHVFEVLRPRSKYDLLYWKYAINNESVMRKILLKCTKKATMMCNVVISEFLQMSVLVPSIEEQRKIGAYLQKYDNMIAARDRQITLLKNLKLALLEQMFVNN